jgi:hypothetical protein
MLIIVSPIKNVILSVGYSILSLETFVMACFDDILKLIKKLPRNFKKLAEDYKEQKHLKLIEEAKRIEAENNISENREEKVIETTFTQTNLLDDEVKIIPHDEDLI